MNIDPSNSPPSALLNALVEAGVEETLNKAVRAFYNGTITPIKAYAAIAQIAGLRLLPSDLVARMKSHQ